MWKRHRKVNSQNFPKAIGIKPIINFVLYVVFAWFVLSLTFLLN